MIDLIEAQQQADRNAIKITSQAAAERTRGDRARRGGESRGGSIASSLTKRKRKGQRKLNEAENMRSDASRRTALNRKLFENLPAIIRESVKPMERIELIKIMQVEGLPGFSNGPAAASGGGGDGAAGAAAAVGPAISPRAWSTRRCATARRFPSSTICSRRSG